MHPWILTTLGSPAIETQRRALLVCFKIALPSCVMFCDHLPTQMLSNFSIFDWSVYNAAAVRHYISDTSSFLLFSFIRRKHKKFANYLYEQHFTHKAWYNIYEWNSKIILNMNKAFFIFISYAILSTLINTRV